MPTWRATTCRPDFQGSIDAEEQNVRAVVLAGADRAGVIAGLGRPRGARGEWTQKRVRI